MMWRTSLVLLVIAATVGCESTDGHTVACRSNAGCLEDYGVPWTWVQWKNEECRSMFVGTVVDACPTEGLVATCSVSVPAANGTFVAERLFVYDSVLLNYLRHNPDQASGCVWDQ